MVVSLAALIGLAATAAGGTALVNRRAAAREQAALAAFPPQGRFVTLGGRRVHAVVAGDGPGVVLIHGAGGNLRDFTFDLMGRLAGRYRVAAFDRPGLGHTDRTRPALSAAFTRDAESPAEQAALLRAAAAALGLPERPVLVGHSYGMTVAMAWALDAPEAVGAVVSLAGVAMPWPGGLGAYYRVNGSALGGALVPPLLAAFAGEGPIRRAVAGVFAPDPVPDGYVAHVGAPLSLRRESFRASTRQVNTLRPHVVAMSRRYPDLRLPIEILHGDRDAIVPLEVHSRPLAALLPQARLTVLPGVGHMPHHAAPEAAVAAIDRAAARAGLR